MGWGLPKSSAHEPPVNEAVTSGPTRVISSVGEDGERSRTKMRRAPTARPPPVLGLHFARFIRFSASSTSSTSIDRPRVTAPEPPEPRPRPISAAPSEAELACWLGRAPSLRRDERREGRSQTLSRTLSRALRGARNETTASPPCLESFRRAQRILRRATRCRAREAGRRAPRVGASRAAERHTSERSEAGTSAVRDCSGERPMRRKRGASN